MHMPFLIKYPHFLSFGSTLVHLLHYKLTTSETITDIQSAIILILRRAGNPFLLLIFIHRRIFHLNMLQE